MYCRNLSIRLIPTSPWGKSPARSRTPDYKTPSAPVQGHRCPLERLGPIETATLLCLNRVFIVVDYTLGLHGTALLGAGSTMASCH